MIDGGRGGWGGHSRLGEFVSVLAHGGAGGRPQVLFLIGPWGHTRICEASEPGGHWGLPPPRGVTKQRGKGRQGRKNTHTILDVSDDF